MINKPGRIKEVLETISLANYDLPNLGYAMRVAETIFALTDEIRNLHLYITQDLMTQRCFFIGSLNYLALFPQIESFRRSHYAIHPWGANPNGRLSTSVSDRNPFKLNFFDKEIFLWPLLKLHTSYTHSTDVREAIYRGEVEDGSEWIHSGTELPRGFEWCFGAPKQGVTIFEALREFADNGLEIASLETNVIIPPMNIPELLPQISKLDIEILPSRPRNIRSN